jgi:hypothetical protein
VPLWGKILVGVFLVLVGGVLVYLLVEIWPAVLAATGAAKPSSTTTAHAKTISVFGASYSPDPDVTLLLLVAVLSALGSYVHAAQSFVDFAGNRRLVVSWTWWYIFRILIGVALAEIFYFAIRAGFFGTDTPTTDINPYGIAAIAGWSACSPSRPPTSSVRSSRPFQPPRAMATTSGRTAHNPRRLSEWQSQPN